jgi:hypothetical protein
MAATTLPPGVTLQQIDGGSTYFADHGFTYAVNMGWDDPDFFSIGVWAGTMNTATDAARWNDLGLNTMVVLGPKPITATTLSLMQQNDISYIAYAGDLSASPASLPNMVGILATDEPDSWSEVSTPIATTSNAYQDHRFWYENNNWYFMTDAQGGLTPISSSEQVLRTLVTTPNGTQRHIDVSGTDTYWFAGAGANVGWVLGAGAEIGADGIVDSVFHRDMTADEAARGSMYGDAVDMFRDLQVTYPAPIAQFIETGGPYGENTTGASYISPPELNWAVWSSLIHGAGQIIYFNHSFGGPAFSYDNLGNPYYDTIQPGQTISIYDQVNATNALIEQLAPVLNSPFALDYATVDGPSYTFGSDVHPLGGLEVMTKYYNDDFYIFADTRMSETQHNIPATFNVNDPTATSVDVINENRTIPIVNGEFTDTFANAWTVHIYHVNDSGEPPPPPPPPPPPSPGETITGTSGNDVLVGTDDSDTISGLAGNDTINGAGGADILSGGRGHDLFVLDAGEADGDLILDFRSNGQSSDHLEFSGYGQGTFTQVDPTHWAIGYEGNSAPAEVIQLADVSPSDFHFVV